ncbi:MAG TPA: amidohydrolase family protein [Anaerolineales bacterium]|jgi:predicted TIM-barrel fold metal-dependent hydrolase|nr:amidohydrolase family protein [Anaerolineales bacterium]
MKLKDFKPQPKLVTKSTRVEKPKFPVIDAHNHLGEPFGGGWDRKPLSDLLDRLEEAGVTHYVDLDGGWGEDILYAHLKYFKEGAPERFQIFGGVDWSKWESLGNGFPDWAAGRLKIQKETGAQGLKIWKPFGLHVRDQHGKLVKVDDARLDPIWEAAGELGLPILIHVADPVAFFDSIDETNERWEELGKHPDWAFTSPPFPPFLEILNGLKNLISRHPATIFIGAHVGCYGENLGWVGQMLDECPNYFIDISARLGELGRQPYTARKFFIQYQDRILFGSDMGPNLDAYRLYYRFLESDDEYFNYNTTEVPAQGRWYVCGMYLPDDVLRKIYSENARRILKID